MKVEEGLYINDAVFLDNSGHNHFGSIRIGPTLWHQFDRQSISEEDVLSNKEVDDFDPFTSTCSLTWFMLDGDLYVSLSRMEYVQFDVIDLDSVDLSRRDTAPNVLYCPDNDNIITKQAEDEEKWGLMESEYYYTLHKNGDQQDIDIDRVSPVKDKSIVEALPDEYASKIISFVV